MNYQIEPDINKIAEIGSPMLKRLNHIGVCIWDMEKCLKLWKGIFGVKASAEEVVNDTKVVMLSIGDILIEIMAPDNNKGIIAKQLEKRGEGIQHVCFEVDDIYKAIDELTAKGIEMIDKKPREGAEGEVAFIHPKYTFGILTEIVKPYKHAASKK